MHADMHKLRVTQSITTILEFIEGTSQSSYSFAADGQQMLSYLM